MRPRQVLAVSTTVDATTTAAGSRGPSGATASDPRPGAAGSWWAGNRRRVALVAGLVLAYLLASLGLWWPVWSTHPTSTFLCGCGDPGQYLWFFAAPAEAMRHGHLPFFTGADYHPGGVNMLDNPGVLGLAVVAAPITWTFGVVAAVNTVLLVTPVLSALAGFAALRRWVRWWPAAALGSAFYGFSPFVVSGLQYVHLQAVFLAIPPLVLMCLDELLVRQRRRLVPVGIALGVLLVVQYLVSPEMLVLVAIVGAVGVAMLVVYAALRHPDELRRRLPAALRGLGAGAVTAAVLVAYPVWFALAGPRHTVGAPWAFIAETGNNVKDFLVPGSAAYRPAIDPTIFGYFGDPGPAENYLGPVLVGAIAAVALVRRSRVVWFAGTLILIVGALSLGTVLITSPSSLIVPPHQHAHTQWWLPWTIIAHIPLADEASPGRLSGILDLFVALVAAVGLDHLVSVLRRQASVPHQGRSTGSAAGVAASGPVPANPPGQADRRRRRWLSRAVPAAVGLAVAAAVLVPLGLTYRVPMRTSTVQAPLWFRTTADHLPRGAVVLALPWGLSQTSAWQAIGGMRFTMAGGDAFVPGPHGRVLQRPLRGSAAAALTDLSTFAAKPEPTMTTERTVRRALRRWGVTTVVVSRGIGPPGYAVGFLAATLGAAPVLQEGAWVWSNVGHAPAPWTVPPTAVFRCAAASTQPLAVARCVDSLATPPPAPS